MSNTRSPSDVDPFRHPEIARRTAIAVIRAAAMGLLPPGRLVARPDADALVELLGYLQRAGIGRGIVRDVSGSYDAGRVTSLLDDLEDALAESPVPHAEWPALEPIFDHDRLARLVGVSPSSVRRYASGARPTPDDVAARLHFLALVVGDLAGSYNEIGVRRWFDRERSQLDGRAPAEILQGSWDPNDPGPVRVRRLSAALLGAPST